MIQDRLMINDAKTEFLLVGTRQQLDQLLWAVIVSVQAHVLKTLDRGLTAT